ncbi:hypothetical protein A0H81_13480 [Grifola frondosa]|uniref:Uncharacterized protein n=1 Tax=Grifola frondosa TaxID=5627 RepID=A0A1C7LRL3_GRIFR|nr:hypothetical protein A0H81_13480 [Grifola frondosa]
MSNLSDHVDRISALAKSIRATAAAAAPTSSSHAGPFTCASRSPPQPVIHDADTTVPLREEVTRVEFPGATPLRNLLHPEWDGWTHKGQENTNQRFTPCGIEIPGSIGTVQVKTQHTSAPVSPSDVQEETFWNTPAAAARTLHFTGDSLLDEHVDLGNVSAVSFGSPVFPRTMGDLAPDQVVL